MALPGYRLFYLDRAGHIASPPVEFRARDDAAAQQRALELLDGRTAELWRRNQQLAIYPGPLRTQHPEAADGERETWT